MRLREDYEANYQSLIDLMEKQNAGYDAALIRRAYEWCVTAHKGQRRSSHEEFYLHPYSVAKIIVQLGLDSEAVAAALLHDVVEDTAVTIEQVEKDFGPGVALLVDGVTKMGRISFSTKEQQQSENLRKMLIAMAQDIRVMIIKLADRLHNMRTIDAMSAQKQRDKSLETLEIYAPIAHRLGIRAMKEELEDLAIAHLDPIAYHDIEQSLRLRKPYREEILHDISGRIEERLRRDLPGIDFHLEGRVKSIYGIYRKMYVQGKDFDEIYDIYAIRVIVDSVTDCYNVLGIMHDMFRPIPGRFKDYISTPKPNLYQSLHTTVIGRDGIPFEIQIRTWEMHHTAEYGVAAHWKYKEGIHRSDQKMEERLAWIRQILETSQNESENGPSLVQAIKTDLSQDDIFAVTPKGDVINLPVGATVIDFAFAIHSEVGIRMVGAKADGRIVPLNHEIHTGEIIEILTTNQPGHGPSRDWMNIAATNQAKTKIRSWFKRERRDENIEAGKRELERECKRNGIALPENEMLEFLQGVAHRQRFATLDDFYAAIGYGGILLFRIMPRMKEDYNKIVRTSRPPEPEILPESAHRHASDGVIIDGIDDCLIKFSKCCAPLPGDEIIGFITRGHGVSIHKRDCNNVPKNILESEEPERWVQAHWSGNYQENFTSTLQITGIDRDGFLFDITSTLYNLHVALQGINSRQIKSGNCVALVTVRTESLEHLNSIITRLSKLHGVFSVERTNQ